MNQELNCAIQAALKAGDEILKIYNDPQRDFEVEVKKDNSPLTIADRRAHEAILSCLKESPYPILSEEGEQPSFLQRAAWETLWIVDPLDGTKEFIKRNGDFTVNIALWENGALTLGVIYVPVHRRLYFAHSTIGAYRCHDITIHNTVSLMDHAEKLPLQGDACRPFTVVASVSHMNEQTTDYINSIKITHPDIQILSRGSSLKICLVAEGSADVYPRFGPTMEWDTAAGHAIALMAGKNLYSSEQQTPLVYNKKNLLNPSFIVK